MCEWAGGRGRRRLGVKKGGGEGVYRFRWVGGGWERWVPMYVPSVSVLSVRVVITWLLSVGWWCQMTDRSGVEHACVCLTRVHWMRTCFIMVMAFVPLQEYKQVGEHD